MDGAHVRRHVLADLAIAARCGAHQRALLVAQADGEAVELELGGIFDRRVRSRELELAADARIELRRAGILGVGLRANRKHRRLVAHRRQLLRRRAADALRRRIGRAQLGMLLLQLGEFAKQAVVLGVGDLRRVLDVVQAVMPLELGAQPRHALLQRAHENRRSASGLPGSMPQPTRRCRTASSCRPIAASARSSTSRPASSTTRPPRALASSRPARAIAS